MRESRTYGSVRGARDEIRVPTATVREVQNETSPPTFSASGRRRCRAARDVTHSVSASLSGAAGTFDRAVPCGRSGRHHCPPHWAIIVGAVEETFEPGMTVTSAPSSVTMSASVRARMQTPSCTSYQLGSLTTTRFTRTRHSDIVHLVSSSQLTETRDRVRSFGGYNSSLQVALPVS